MAVFLAGMTIILNSHLKKKKNDCRSFSLSFYKKKPERKVYPFLAMSEECYFTFIQFYQADVWIGFTLKLIITKFIVSVLSNHSTIQITQLWYEMKNLSSKDVFGQLSLQPRCVMPGNEANRAITKSNVFESQLCHYYSTLNFELRAG